MILAWIDRCYNIFATNHMGLRKIVGQKNQKSCFHDFNKEFMLAYKSMMNAVGVESTDHLSAATAATSLESFSSLDSATEAIVQRGNINFALNLKAIFSLAIENGTSVTRKVLIDAQTNTGKSKMEK